MEPAWLDIIELARIYRMSRIEYWFNEVLFSFQWWILLVTTSGLLIVWFIILDKKRIFEIITYGSMVAIIANLGDTIGLSFSLWGYQYTLMHLPEIIEIHNILMPVLYMIIYQYFHTWKSFLIATAINAFVFAFILEPLLVWLQIYELYHWEYIYSLIPYFVIAVVLKWVVYKFKQQDINYQ